MAGRLLLTSQIEIQIPGEAPFEFGNRGQVYPLTIAGTFDSWRGSIANNTTVTLWDSTTSSVGSFEFFVVKSDQAVLIEFQGTSTSDNADIKVRANFPMYLTQDDILGYSSGGSFGGSAQVIRKILCRNASGSTAVVQAVAIL